MKKILVFICKSSVFFILTAILSLQLFSCVSNPEAFKKIDSAVAQSDFDSAAELISKNKSGGLPIYNEMNLVSFYIDKGLLEYYSGKYAESSQSFLKAENLINEIYKKSSAQGFLFYINSDILKDYPGEDYEDIYINIFNALNYYNMGDYNSALAEINKLHGLDGKLNFLVNKYEYKDPLTGSNLNVMTYNHTGINTMPDSKTSNYSNSVLARFLNALFYQADGNISAAKNEFDLMQRAFYANSHIYNHPLPADENFSLNVPNNKARLNIISFTGLSPDKEEKKIAHFLPFYHFVLQIALFRLPILKNRSSEITRVEAVVNDNPINLELLEDIGEVSKEIYNAHYSNTVAKTYIRTVIKYTIADIAAYDTAKRKEDVLAGFLMAVGARAAMDASERADLRMSRYLPDKAYIGCVNLDPGIYSIKINYYNENEIIKTQEYDDVNVKINEINLLQSVNLR